MRLVVLPLALVLCLVAAGCGDSTPASNDGSGGSSSGSGGSGGSADVDDSGTSPADGTYVVTDVSGRRLVDGTRVRLTLEGRQLSADAGCNQMSGSVSVTDGRLVVTGLGMTEMGCEPGRMAQDEWVADLLTSGPEVTTAADGFTLTGDTVTARFTTEAPPEDRPLEGTTWLLESTVDGDVASSSVGGPADAAPRFRIRDGQVVASDGCNDLSGPVAVTGDRISAGEDLVTTSRQCTRAVPPLDVLLGGSTYAVEGDRLTLTRGDTSLVFRAQ